MRSCFVLASLVLFVPLLAWPRHADAQVRDGALRLYGDVNLASYVTATRPAEGQQARLERSTFALGPSSGTFAGGAGLGVGYAVSRRLVPHLYLAAQYLRLKGNAAHGNESHGRQFELRPSLAWLPWPELERLVPHLDLGFSLVHRNRGGIVGPLLSFGRDDGAATATVLGLGPVLTLGAHAFLVEGASLDLGVAFRALFMRDLQGPYGISATRDYSLLLNLGVSFWL